MATMVCRMVCKGKRFDSVKSENLLKHHDSNPQRVMQRCTKEYTHIIFDVVPCNRSPTFYHRLGGTAIFVRWPVAAV